MPAHDIWPLMKRSPTDGSSKRESLKSTLHQRILHGHYRPGEQLRQIYLAKEFGVAQSVVRELLQELEYHGLVRTVENLGAFVRELGPAQLIEAYQVREMLEGLAARLCCRHAGRADIEWLEAKARAIYEAAIDPAIDRGELEQQFHYRFVELSRNETLARMSYGYRFLGNLVVTNRDREDIHAEHSAIVRAVAEDRPDDAERVAREHVRRSAQSIAEWATHGA